MVPAGLGREKTLGEDPVIRELSAAVERSPDVVELRLHLAGLLADRGRYAEALGHCSAALSQDASNTSALSLVQRCSTALAAPAAAAAEAGPGRPAGDAQFDWSSAERQVADIIEPAFVEEPADVVNEGDFDVVARSNIRLDDVAGMADVKRQIELSLLGPIRNPELMKAYKVSARGGLLLYGPPGCGKTYIAKAISGELGANFYQVGIADVLHHWFGESERSIRSVFDSARRNAPCVLFFDELDALGHRRSALSGSSGMRPVVNTLLEEMDSATSVNDGVYVLGATNAPWDVDPALRLDPASPDGLVLRGSILHDLGRIRESTESYRQALALDANHAAALNNMAVNRLQRGKFGHALRGFLGAAGSDPTLGDLVRRNIGAVLAKMLRRLTVVATVLAVLIQFVGFNHGDGHPTVALRMVTGVVTAALIVILGRLLYAIPRAVLKSVLSERGFVVARLVHALLVIALGAWVTAFGGLAWTVAAALVLTVAGLVLTRVGLTLGR